MNPMVVFNVIAVLCFTSISFVLAADPDPLQDFCVADLSSKDFVNGYPCKDPSLATVEDFVFSLAKGLSTNNSVNASNVIGNVNTWPALNTLGLSIARLDFGIGGIIPPHVHPFASELVYVEQGSVYAGFVTQDNRLFAKVLNKGEVIIVPRALVHWQLNVGKSPAKVIVTLNNQALGSQIIGVTMFGSGIRSEVLEKTFFVSKETVQKLVNATLSSGFI